MSFTHTIRPRYAEVDQQGVVFNAHWLTYFDEAYLRFFESLGFPAESYTEPGGADVMLVKAVIEWKGPAGFNEPVTIAVRPDRLGTSSLDVRYIATVGDRPACECVITYVVIEPGTHTPKPIPDRMRAVLERAMATG